MLTSTVTCMLKPFVRRARSSRRSVLYAVTGLALMVLAAAATAVGSSMGSVWNGAPYPSADPNTVAQRLKDRSDAVYDGFALPGRYTADSGRIDTGACYYRGLKGIAHIDEARSDVRSFGLDWSVPGVPEATARDAERRVRKWMVKQGWKRTHDGDRTGETLRELGSRFGDPQSGDQVDIEWNDATTTLFIRLYAPCGHVPDDFNEYDWPQADWNPKGQP